MKYLFLLTSLMISMIGLAQDPSIYLSAAYDLNNNAFDLINDNDGNIWFGVTAVPDRFGNAGGAMYFNGSEDVLIDFEPSDDFSPSELDSAITVTLWYSGGSEDDGDLEYMVRRFGSNGGYAVGLFDLNKPLMFNMNTNVWVDDEMFETVPEDNWNFLVCVFQREAWRFYFNGEMIDEESVYGPQTISDNLNHVLFGDSYVGALDDVKFYKAALTDQQINDLYEEESQIVSVGELSPLNDVNLYPNPTNELVSFNLENTDVDQYKIFDTMGSCVMDERAIQAMNSADISALSSGVYFVGFFQDGVQIYTKRLVVDK